jgi:endonuclease/exonuclease/phosphatase (EEP) superfamily protein YafD
MAAPDTAPVTGPGLPGRRMKVRARLRRLRPLVPVAGWIVVLPLCGVALARLVAWDSRSLLVGANALTPLLFLPAWPVAVMAGALRRWALLVVSTALVLAHVVFVLPELRAAEPVPAAARSAPTLRVFDANVNFANRDVEGYAREIRRARPDLVVLQEAVPGFRTGLEATGVLADLPHRLSISRPDPFAAVVASRWPLSVDDILSVAGRPIALRVTVDFPGTPIRLFGVHAVSPVAGNREEWIHDLQALTVAVAAEDLPVLIAGDFNATWDHRWFRHLLDAGLTDGAAARGRAFHMTWPRNLRIIPPVTRIDHVLTTTGLVTTRITTGEGRGSDHRPLVADVAVIQT